jgi:hypothetical protein
MGHSRRGWVNGFIRGFNIDPRYMRINPPKQEG